MRDQKYINFYETHLSTAENRKKTFKMQKRGRKYEYQI